MSTCISSDTIKRCVAACSSDYYPEFSENFTPIGVIFTYHKETHKKLVVLN